LLGREGSTVPPAKDARMSSERLSEPSVRRGLVGAAILGLWLALLAALGLLLVGLALVALAAVVGLVVLVVRHPPKLRKPSLPSVHVSVPRVPLEPVGRRTRQAVALVPPLARRGRDGGRRALATVPPLAERGRSRSARLARRAAPVFASAAQATVKARDGALGPIERRRRRAALVKEAWELNAAGVEHRRDGRASAAVDAHERAVTLFRQAADDRSEGLALNNLGLALMTDGDDVGAIDAFERALVLLAKSGDTQSEGRVLANLGTLHRRLDRQETALVYWRQALTRLDADSPEHERMSELVEIAS
jgi:tetratricopeptide (TPR) repeat protein